LTRVVDKRKVRRDLADFFSTHAEGVKGRRAVEWRLVDQVVPKSKFSQVVAERAKTLAAKSDRPAGSKGLLLPPLDEQVAADGVQYRHVTLKLDSAQRVAELIVRGPTEAAPADGEALLAAGGDIWPIRAFRELDDALLRLRLNYLEIGAVILKTEGDPERVMAFDAFLADNRTHWAAREVLHFQKRVLKRLDLTSKTFFAFVQPGSCFAGVLAELLFA